MGRHSTVTETTPEAPDVCEHKNSRPQGDTPLWVEDHAEYWDVIVCSDCGEIIEKVKPTENSEHLNG